MYFFILGVQILPSVSFTSGKNRQNRKLLAGKFCDLERKHKEIHKGNPSTLEGNLPCRREILPSLQGKNIFSRPVSSGQPTKQIMWNLDHTVIISITGLINWSVQVHNYCLGKMWGDSIDKKKIHGLKNSGDGARFTL